MRVMVIVKATESSEAGVMPSAEMFAAMRDFNEALQQAGLLVAGEGLQPSLNGKRVRFAGTDRTVIDGPFSETKELIAGYWIWNVKDMEEAVTWLKRCPNPHPEACEVEIRPVYELDDFGEALVPEMKAQFERIFDAAQKAQG